MRRGLMSCGSGGCFILLGFRRAWGEITALVTQNNNGSYHCCGIIKYITLSVKERLCVVRTERFKMRSLQP
jgi:hypothetical protein